LDADLLDRIADTAFGLAEHDPYISWRLRNQLGYPRSNSERRGATTEYLSLLDRQLDNIERLRK